LILLLFFGADEANRTPDLLITNQLLYQLSYISEDAYSSKESATAVGLIHEFYVFFAKITRARQAGQVGHVYVIVIALFSGTASRPTPPSISENAPCGNVHGAAQTAGHAGSAQSHATMCTPHHNGRRGSFLCQK
jgi:hypothetical protein